MSTESTLRDRLGPTDRLIETLRFDPDKGFIQLEAHLARMQRSAKSLGFAYARPALDEALSALEREGMARIRITLGRDGDVDITSQPFTPLPDDTIWDLAIAETRLSSSDPMLAHKTTLRAPYEAARAEWPTEEADEVLLMNERGELCEGTFTNLFIDLGDGMLLTPPQRCGLLPGILRQKLLGSGKAKEAIISLEKLSTAADIYVGNSLRGLIRANWVA